MQQGLHRRAHFLVDAPGAARQRANVRQSAFRAAAAGGSMDKQAWFRPMGLVFRPVSWQGAACLAATVAFCVMAFVAVDRHSHSVSDTLFGVFPYIAPAWLLLAWLAGKTGGAAADERPQR
jgi:hypothetical protein